MRNYPDEYLQYLVYFHADRDYFECHEVLEDYWKREPSSPNSIAWLGLIQVAVSIYHHRRGNIAGARKMLQTALTNLPVDQLTKLGIDADLLISLLKRRQSQMNNESNLTFTDLNIPFANVELLQACKEKCIQQHGIWQQPSNLEDTQLIHKHTLRDRSGVIQERRRQLTNKYRQRDVGK